MPGRSVDTRLLPSRRRGALTASVAALLVSLVPAARAAPPSAPAPKAPAAGREVPLPPPPPGTSLQKPAPPAPERCGSCHGALSQGRVVHAALEMGDCTDCHKAVAGQSGKCRSRAASKWALVKSEPDLCYGCHDRKDGSKAVHTIVRQGTCLACHDAHSSNFAGLTRQAPEKLCLDCHDVPALLPKPVKHAPVAEGRCLVCHNPHGGEQPKGVRASGNASCLKCHDATAPKGPGTPAAAYRIDMKRKVVHPALSDGDCTSCHESGHSSDNLRLLKKNAVDLCYECHDRKDKEKFPHSAVVVGDCAVCHDPHSSDNAKLVAKATTRETCFICHQDDVTGRKVIHPALDGGCDQCHDPHGAKSRFALKVGEGKAGCYTCHDAVDTGKNKHAALERYGCTVCHDPHGTANAAMLVKPVNAVCIACHDAQKDPKHVTPIAASHPLGGGLKDPRRKGREFSCASCHNPHGSDHPKLFYFGETPMDSCAWCHGDKSGDKPEMKNVISNALPTPPDAAAKGAPRTEAAGAGAPAAPVAASAGGGTR